MSEHEKKLLRVLVILAIALFIFVGFSLLSDYRRGMKDRTAVLKREIATLKLVEKDLPQKEKRLDELQVAATERKQESPSDIYAFAGSIASRIQEEGLKCSRSAVSGSGEKAVVDFDLNGSAIAILGILKEISDKPGYRVLSVKLTMNERDGTMDSLMRIGHDSTN